MPPQDPTSAWTPVPDASAWVSVGEPEGMAKTPTPPKQPPATFLSETLRQLKATGQGLKDMVTGPYQPAQETAKHVIGNVVGPPLRELAGEPQEGKSVLTAPESFPARVFGAADVAVGGDPAAGRAHLASKEYGAALADFAAIPTATFGVGKLLKMLLPEAAVTAEQTGKRANALANASGTSSRVSIPEAFRTALPEMEKTAAGKTPATFPAFQSLIQDTLTRTENEFAQALRPIAQQQVVPTNLANAIRAKMVPMAKTAADREWNAALQARAAEFQQPFTYAELNQQRMSAGDRLDAFYNKAPSAQAAAAGSHADQTVDRIIQQESREAIYAALERQHAGTKPPGYFRQLKQRQSALIDIKDQLAKQAIALDNAAATPLLDKIRGRGFASGSGHLGLSIGNVAAAFQDEGKSAVKNIRKGMRKPRDLRPALGGALPPVARRQEPSLAPDAEPDPDAEALPQ